MLKTTKTALLATFAALSLTANPLLAQQIKTPAPSPMQTVKQAFGLGDITLEYSRPIAKGRVIFGDVVPYDKVWRTGANATTKITFSEDVMMEGKAVKAGTYGLYTIPGKASWTIMLYKDLTLGGNVGSYTEANELLRFTVKPMMMATSMQSFTLNLDAVAPAAATLQIIWDKTLVPIRITTDIDERIMKSIETSMKPGDSRPYFQAASYYYDNNKDLNQALTWANKAIEQSNAFYIVHLKAKIQLKMKDYKGAIATANESRRLAQEAKNEDYVRMNDKIIADAGGR